jgi:hypothetical protein
MLLSTEAQNSSDSLFKENIILRPFISIDVNMEFRGFVFQRHLTYLSQYNYFIYSQRLCQWKDHILEKIISFFKDDQQIFSFIFKKFLRWTGFKKPNELEIQEERDQRMRSEYLNSIDAFPHKIDQLLNAIDRVCSYHTNYIYYYSLF